MKYKNIEEVKARFLEEIKEKDDEWRLYAGMKVYTRDDMLRDWNNHESDIWGIVDSLASSLMNLMGREHEST